MTAHSDLGWGGRWVAGILAAVWIASGTAVIVIMHRDWLAIVLGLVAIAYGLVWVEVTRTGRRFRWRRARRR
jgi:hypothetical protein